MATVTATDMVTIMLINMRKLSKIFICAFAAASLMSCSKEPSGEPFMLFEIHGKVMDADGNPLEGIHVISGQADIQKTNINGVFTFFGRSVPSEHALLTFEDKDGEINALFEDDLPFDINADIGFALDDLQFEFPLPESARKMLAELEFATILKKDIFAESVEDDKIENIAPELRPEAEIINTNTEMEIENNAQE